MKIIFATQNPNKVKEIQKLLPDHIELLSLKELNYTKDIPEDHPTLRANALQKAETINKHFNLSCFADDTGLEIEALNGAPGVYSARYAGPAAIADNNIDKVLKEMKGHTNRKAQFRTVIALIFNNSNYFFEGKVKGEIIYERTGSDGFGYDPIFKPGGYDQSFAEMTLDEKNTISHRAEAVRKLVRFLKKYSN